MQKLDRVNRILLCRDAARRLQALACTCGVEVGGFILGYIDGDSGVSMCYQLGCNVAEHPRIEFLVDPVTTLKVSELADEKGLEVIAVIHTHPSGHAVPSARDASGMAVWRVVWVIASCMGELRAWMLERGGPIREVEVVVEGRDCGPCIDGEVCHSNPCYHLAV
ncbi:hypothetical protein Pyrfu_0246 [Pyrolobus fumarii 1A]|uniref:JAB domain-containing protein n=1 Tax=Pyrolobus fumarii (strain DSM 11204 / 1A) TaxID=694429 RepID=G0EF75_PYRF1|nr:M67 family metallopeptidase [Pyrolobus fumarii]AEM38118.1 hypothetical protein Pyrfu_0246 [Pyrolobus fumarii 1A]